MSGHFSPDHRIEATEAGSLIINSVKTTDKAVYVCAAVNSAGSALKKAWLNIEADGWFFKQLIFWELNLHRSN